MFSAEQKTSQKTFESVPREWSFLFKANSKQSFTLLPVLHVLSFNIDTQNEASASVNPVINQGDKT